MLTERANSGAMQSVPGGWRSPNLQIAAESKMNK